MRDRWDSPKCDLMQDRQRGNKDFGAAFLEKMNDKLFWCGTKIACGRWRKPYLVSVALRTEVYICHQIQNAKNIGNFTTLLKPHNIGTHLKGIETSFQVVPLFLKSFHFWVSHRYITFLNFLKIPSILKELTSAENVIHAFPKTKVNVDKKIF
jgi:hypothetical protein